MNTIPTDEQIMEAQKKLMIDFYISCGDDYKEANLKYRHFMGEITTDEYFKLAYEKQETIKD